MYLFEELQLDGVLEELPHGTGTMSHESFLIKCYWLSLKRQRNRPAVTVPYNSITINILCSVSSSPEGCGIKQVGQRQAFLALAPVRDIGCHNRDYQLSLLTQGFFLRLCADSHKSGRLATFDSSNSLNSATACRLLQSRGTHIDWI